MIFVCKLRMLRRLLGLNDLLCHTQGAWVAALDRNDVKLYAMEKLLEPLVSQEGCLASPSWAARGDKLL